MRSQSRILFTQEAPSWRILGPNNINQGIKKISEIEHKFLDSVDKVNDGIMCVFAINIGKPGPLLCIFIYLYS